MTMKLMSWNVNGRTKKETLNDQLVKIKGEDIHILALQEVEPENVEGFKEGLREIGLKHVVTNYDLPDILNLKTGPSKNGKAVDGVLIASRWPLELIPEFFEKIPWQKSALSTSVRTPYGEVEAHTVHVPNASSSGRWEEKPDGNWNYGSPNRKRGRQIKVATFNGIYEALAKPSERHRLLCGDFNSPKEERCNGKVIYFGETKEHRRSEEQVLSGLAEYNLADTYIKLCGYARIKHNGYEGPQYSHINNKKNKHGEKPKRRFDHIFSSSSLNPQKCGYLHHESGDLSDHSPVYAVYKPKPIRLRIKKKR